MDAFGMLSSTSFTPFIFGFCIICCWVTAYFIARGREAGKLTWLCIAGCVIACLYLTSVLLTGIIQRAVLTDDGFVNIYDDEYLTSIYENTIGLILAYVGSAITGSYFGAKRKFTSDRQ